MAPGCIVGRAMNRKQRIAIFVGAAVFALLVLVPPWGSAGRGTSVRWSPVFLPPRGKRIDHALLCQLELAVVVATFGVFVYLGRRKPESP